MAQSELPLQHPHPEWVEQDAALIWTQTKQCLDETIAKIGAKNIQSIGITNQRETSIAWQKSTGMALGAAINWQCRRSASRCEELSEHAEIIKQKTGLPLDAYFSASKFEWHIKNTPNVQHLLNLQDICFGTVDAWILWHLTEGKSHATDITNASRTMLFNISTRTYDTQLCHIFGIPITSLPNVQPSIGHFGNYIIKDASIPIQGMIGDQQAALYAQCGQQQGVIKNTYGTGLFMMANTGPHMVQTNHLITTIAIGVADQVSYAIEGSVFTGGALIQWLRDGLGIIKSAKDTQALAESVDDNAGVTIIPALTGLGAPHWKPDAKGMILGLTRHATKAHIVRAALEAIALQSNDLIDLIRKECPAVQFESLLVDGGASANDWLMQLQSDVSNITISRPESVEATALGAAMCAQMGTGKPPRSNPTIFRPKGDQSSLTTQWKDTLTTFIT
jgi:glycerol kinase